jgi:hypothetical protein
MGLNSRTRLFIALVCVSFLAGTGLFLTIRPDGLVDQVVAFMGCQLGAFVSVILPYGVVYLGWLKLRDQQDREVQALGDDNTVTADPEGPRKLHEYLTAITSMEARIGLLQRSEPYPGDPPPQS